MLIPIKCTCGSYIANKYSIFLSHFQQQEISKLLDDLLITKYCCRLKFITCARIEEYY